MEKIVLAGPNITEENLEADYSELKRESTIRRLRLVGYNITKKIIDIVCGVIGMLFLIPLAIIVKILYLATGDKDPIFFSQDRIGTNGKVFKFYKFRTMHVGADEELERLLKKNKKLAKEYKINKKLKNDPRITKIGKFLRNNSLDEFPQFINVLKGDMSIIGNRPYLPREREDMGDYFYDVTKTKCGIISYWAVNGRNDVTFETRLKMEQYYSNNRSLIFDIKILIKAFFLVFLRKRIGRIYNSETQ